MSWKRKEHTVQITLTHASFLLRLSNSGSLCLEFVVELWSALRLGMIGCNVASGITDQSPLLRRKLYYKEEDSSSQSFGWLDALLTILDRLRSIDAGVGRGDGQACMRTSWKGGTGVSSPVIGAFGLAFSFAQPCRRLNHTISSDKSSFWLWCAIIYQDPAGNV